jgi:hypothetical protein
MILSTLKGCFNDREFQKDWLVVAGVGGGSTVAEAEQIAIALRTIMALYGGIWTGRGGLQTIQPLLSGVLR